MQALNEHNWVSFRVNKAANKLQVKEAVEKIFKVAVLHVNVANVKGKCRRFGKNVGKPHAWKKAMVRLKEGDKIEIFEGV